MIDVKYTIKNVKFEEEQKKLLKEKVQRKFGKYKEDINFDVKISSEKNRYTINVLGNFKKHQIESKDEGYDILKLVDVAIKKVSSQINKIESKY